MIFTFHSVYLHVAISNQFTSGDEFRFGKYKVEYPKSNIYGFTNMTYWMQIVEIISEPGTDFQVSGAIYDNTAKKVEVFLLSPYYSVIDRLADGQRFSSPVRESTQTMSNNMSQILSARGSIKPFAGIHLY